RVRHGVRDGHARVAEGGEGEVELLDRRRVDEDVLLTRADGAENLALDRVGEVVLARGALRLDVGQGDLLHVGEELVLLDEHGGEIPEAVSAGEDRGLVLPQEGEGRVERLGDVLDLLARALLPRGEGAEPGAAGELRDGPR